MMSPSFTFIKSAPNFTSVACDVTNYEILQRVKIAPLSVMGSPSLRNEPRNKFPDERLLALFEDR